MSGTLQSNLHALSHFPHQQSFELDVIITPNFSGGETEAYRAIYLLGNWQS